LTGLDLFIQTQKEKLMHYPLEKQDFEKITPLLGSMPPDPMMHTVLEGNQAGRVIADHPRRPTAALIWSGMEYAYLVGEKAEGFITALKPYLEDTILPAVGESGLGFVSVFPENQAVRQSLLSAFADRAPTSYGMNGYIFDLERFQAGQKDLPPLPEGYTLVKLDRDRLGTVAFQAAREDLEFCWESIDRYLEFGSGCAVVYEGRPVSSCYTIAYGAGAYHITICTGPKHRRKGLARRAAAALVADALEEGKTNYWINDAPNTASRRLAESLGFVYTGDIYPVDIPAEPGPFHRGLAGHFAGYLEDYHEAERLYRTALRFNPEDQGSQAGLARVQEKLGKTGEG
jgi:GNAT superfamily N-acetyltransferase